MIRADVRISLALPDGVDPEDEDLQEALGSLLGDMVVQAEDAVAVRDRAFTFRLAGASVEVVR